MKLKVCVLKKRLKRKNGAGHVLWWLQKYGPEIIQDDKEKLKK